MSGHCQKRFPQSLALLRFDCSPHFSWEKWYSTFGSFLSEPLSHYSLLFKGGWILWHGDIVQIHVMLSNNIFKDTTQPHLNPHQQKLIILSSFKISAYNLPKDVSHLLSMTLEFFSKFCATRRISATFTRKASSVSTWMRFSLPRPNKLMASGCKIPEGQGQAVKMIHYFIHTPQKNRI